MIFVDKESQFYVYLLCMCLNAFNKDLGTLKLCEGSLTALLGGSCSGTWTPAPRTTCGCWRTSWPSCSRCSRRRGWCPACGAPRRRRSAPASPPVVTPPWPGPSTRPSGCRAATSTARPGSSGTASVCVVNVLIKLLIRELYQKVINLEQNQCQNEIKISQLASQIESLKADKEEILHRNSNGEFVWKIKDFSSYHQKLRNSHSFVIYSKGFYTSYYGYKVCLRSNVYFSEGKMSL